MQSHDENKKNGESQLIEKMCACGHKKNHHMVTAVGQYSGFAWFLNLFGISCKPNRIQYKCLKCDKCFDETTDPKDLNHFL